MEDINEQVSVILRNKTPTELFWNGRTYQLTAIGLHHTLHEGRTLIHMFSATDGTTCFSLRFDTETLRWRLLGVADGL